MKRTDRIKLDFIRNWRLPGAERLASWLKTSPELKTTLKDGIIWLIDEDIALYTTADNYIEHTILSTGTYETEIGKLIRTSLKSGFVALDVGANIGLQSIRMSQSCGEAGHVYAFEPLNYIRDKFNKNIALNKCSNVTLLPFALSDTEGVTDVKIDDQIWNQGTFSLNQSGNHGFSEQINIRIADNIPEIEHLHRIDLIKIDVEGFEMHVLRGLNNTLIKHRPRVIFEYDINYWKNNGQEITECYNLFMGLNYQLYQITKVGCEHIHNALQIADGNLFCIPINE